MRIMILGAAGEIGRMVTANLLEQTDFDLTLYGRNVTSRLASISDSRVKLVDGTFEDTATIKANLTDVDAVYLNFVAEDPVIKPLLKIMEGSRSQAVHPRPVFLICMKK